MSEEKISTTYVFKELSVLRTLLKLFGGDSVTLVFRNGKTVEAQAMLLANIACLLFKITASSTDQSLLVMPTDQTISKQELNFDVKSLVSTLDRLVKSKSVVEYVACVFDDRIEFEGLNGNGFAICKATVRAIVLQNAESSSLTVSTTSKTDDEEEEEEEEEDDETNPFGLDYSIQLALAFDSVLNGFGVASAKTDLNIFLGLETSRVGETMMLRFGSADVLSRNDVQLPLPFAISTALRGQKYNATFAPGLVTLMRNVVKCVKSAAKGLGPKKKKSKKLKKRKRNDSDEEDDDEEDEGDEENTLDMPQDVIIRACTGLPFGVVYKSDILTVAVYGGSKLSDASSDDEEEVKPEESVVTDEPKAKRARVSDTTEDAKIKEVVSETEVPAV